MKRKLVREALRWPLATLKELQEFLASILAVYVTTIYCILYMSGLWSRGAGLKPLLTKKIIQPSYFLPPCTHGVLLVMCSEQWGSFMLWDWLPGAKSSWREVWTLQILTILEQTFYLSARQWRKAYISKWKLGGDLKKVDAHTSWQIWRAFAKNRGKILGKMCHAHLFKDQVLLHNISTLMQLQCFSIELYTF